ncbi:MAG TPA: hypothetical protein VM782_19350, partial [Stellaceae bacterium]|nr:hypothetical protein [Stellaceae bacterium]
MIDRTVLICLGLSAICAAALPLEFRSEIADTTTTAAPSEASVAKPAVDAPQPAINRLVSAVLARPLFSPSRHPPEAGPDDHLDTPLSDLRLTGILITPDERLAIFAPANSKPVARS